MLTAILMATSCFFGGAYIGTVIDNANESEKVTIVTPNATVGNKALDSGDFWKAGALGLVAFYIYKKFLRGN